MFRRERVRTCDRPDGPCDRRWPRCNPAASGVAFDCLRDPVRAVAAGFGPVADAIGKSRVVRIRLVLLAASFAACAIAPHFLELLAPRGASGVFAGGIFPVAIALVADRSTVETRQAAIARLVVAGITGQMAGAALSGVIAEAAGWRSVFGATSVFTALVAAVASVRRRDADTRSRRLSFSVVISDYRNLLKSPGAVVVYGTVFCEGVFMFGVFPFVASPPASPSPPMRSVQCSTVFVRDG